MHPISDFFATVHHDNGQSCVRDVLAPERRFQLVGSTGQGASMPLAAGSYVIARQAIESQDSAVLVELLAAPNSALWALYGIFAENGLSPCFPPNVNLEAEQWLARPQLDAPELVDLEHIPFITIDGEHSKDLDQALFLQRKSEGTLMVYYALADASHYVPVGSALFEEAMQRAASYYLPSVMVPMLPRALSEDLVSLNANVPRRAVVFEMELSPDGAVTTTIVKRARIRSRAKLSFAQVQGYYDDPANSDIDNRDIQMSLDCLKEFAHARMARAAERQVVRYRRTEVEATLPGRSQRRFVVTEAIRHPVEAYNEQLSLLCNGEGARLLQTATTIPLIEPIFRVHPSPDNARLDAFRSLTTALTKVHQLPPQWTWQAGQPLADFLGNLPSKPEAVAAAIHRQAVMVNVGSTFQSEPARHFGVGADVYARFSAPMREVVGVFLHRELLQALCKGGLDDEELRTRVVERANQAKKLQKRVTNASNLLILDQLFGEQLANGNLQPGLMATVVGLTPKKIHITLATPPIDAKIHLSDLRNSWNEKKLRVTDDACRVVTPDNQTLVSLGDVIRVVVASHDAKRRHWCLSIVGDESRRSSS